MEDLVKEFPEEQDLDEQEGIDDDVVEKWVDKAISNIAIFNSFLQSKTMPKW